MPEIGVSLLIASRQNHAIRAERYRGYALTAGIGEGSGYLLRYNVPQVCGAIRVTDSHDHAIRAERQRIDAFAARVDEDSNLLLGRDVHQDGGAKIGRASCRERV